MECRDLKISEMPKADHLHGEDLIPIVQHGHNKVIDVQDLVDLFKRILPPPPPKPCPEPWHPEPHHHHHHCDDYCGIDIIGKVREDAAIAKASASAVEGKVAVLEKTSDVALDSAQRAMQAVKAFHGLINQIKHLGLEIALLKAKVFNDRNKIDQLTRGLLFLNERVKDLERKVGITSAEPDFSPSWLGQLQDPFSDCSTPGSVPGDPNMTSEWVDDNVTNPLDGVQPGDLPEGWADDLLHQWTGA